LPAYRLAGAAQLHRRDDRSKSMKVTVDIDCTPLEARQFFGLPDVQPMQAAMMDALEKRMMKEIDNYSPERLLEAWMPLMSANRDLFMNFISAFGQAGGKTKSKDVK
jgi:hypothetical protein